MSFSGFRLDREEIARQIHLVIREIYPDQEVDGNLIHKMIQEAGTEGDKMIFPAGEFGEVTGMAGTDFARQVYLELGVEYEKNLHDKFYFTIRREEGNIIFETVKE